MVESNLAVMCLPGKPPQSAAVWLAISGLLLAALACSRADVPVQAESGEAAGANLKSAVEEPASEPEASPGLSATDAPVPTLTLTPAEPEAPSSPTPPATPTPAAEGRSETILYEAQPGDDLRALGVRFGVLPGEIVPAEGSLPGLLDLVDPGRLLLIPRRLEATGPAERLIPDSEMVFSPHAVDFDPVLFTAGNPGYLNDYREYVGNRWRSGPEVVALAARDNSVNPRLLLALLEYEAGWLTQSDRPSGQALLYPLGHQDPQSRGLFRQLTWLANELGQGYYSWRQGTLTELTLADGSVVRLAPELNAGTVALQYYFALDRDAQAWQRALSPDGFLRTYLDLFGDPWQYMHPLFEPGLAQPPMILPFLPGHVWAFTGGPHGAWEREAAWAALDFAPPSLEAGCVASDDWVVASAPGLVLRSGGGVVVLDLDGDGREQTGWVLIYLHIASKDGVQMGAFIEEGELIGHPSCEGGIATGSHVHMVRKYNGEWILADGSLPFELSGWVAKAGSRPYQGALQKGEQQVLACPCASRQTFISR